MRRNLLCNLPEVAAGTGHDAAGGWRPLEGVNVAHIGHFDPGYSRNRIMRKALRRAGATVTDLCDPRGFARRAAPLVWGSRALRPDVVLVGFPGQADVGLARLATLTMSCPVVLDAFVSLYETNVEDRRTTSPHSIQALRYRVEDVLSCRMAHRVLLDTDAHAEYFADDIGVPRSKLRRVWLGADEDVMRPQSRKPTAPFRVFFYGSFIPLHGLEHVVRAAHLLEKAGEAVDFTVIGTGQTYDETVALCADLGVSTVRFLGPRRYDELPALMAESHLCLGIFGTSGKAARVIPNKVFDALAVGCPVLTADTPAIREALTHGEHAWLCPPGDPASLAEAVAALKADDAGRQAMAARGHELFRRRFSLDALAGDVAGALVDLL